MDGDAERKLRPVDPEQLSPPNEQQDQTRVRVHEMNLFRWAPRLDLRAFRYVCNDAGNKEIAFTEVLDLSARLAPDPSFLLSPASHVRGAAFSRCSKSP